MIQLLNLASSCSQKKIIDSEYYCKKLDLNCIRANKLVTFKTSKGNFDVFLYGENYPLTVTNFLNNVKNNIYNDQRFYKIINFPQVKIIHAGFNPERKYFQEKNQISNQLPPFIPLEILLNKNSEPIYKFQIKDHSKTEDIKSFFKKGSLAMVKMGENTSSSTEFFFVTNNISELDGRYSIFGQIVKGFEVLEKVDKQDFIYEIKISN